MSKPATQSHSQQDRENQKCARDCNLIGLCLIASYCKNKNKLAQPKSTVVSTQLGLQVQESFAFHFADQFLLLLLLFDGQDLLMPQTNQALEEKTFSVPKRKKTKRSKLLQVQNKTSRTVVKSAFHVLFQPKKTTSAAPGSDFSLHARLFRLRFVGQGAQPGAHGRAHGLRLSATVRDTAQGLATAVVSGRKNRSFWS